MRKTKHETEYKIVRSNYILNDGCEYKYELRENTSENVISYRMPLYSIKIEMTDANGRQTDAMVNDVFSDIGKALVFYSKLVDNLATPINLPYIFEDEMC